MAAPLLRLSDLRRHFGGVRAVDGVSLEVGQGDVYGLIGPNGAGKTTLVDLVTGFTPAESGAVRLGDVELTGRPPHAVARLGVARTFQSIRVYRSLTAVENVVVGMHVRRPHDTLRQLAPLPAGRRAQAERVERARRLLALVGVDPEADGDRPAGTLPYASQRRVEIARALALEPRLLILDEPAAGMTATEKQQLRETVARLNENGLTVILIEHDMGLVMSMCRRIAVLDFGRKIAEGTPEQVSSDPAVLAAYLGLSGDSEQAARSRASTTEPAPPASPAFLEVEGLEVSYGAVRALRGVSFTVARGELVALVGANGAGKSTILNTLSGLVRPQAGRAEFDGLDLTRARPERIVAHGLVQVPEGREILARLTVRENLELAAWTRRDRDAVAAEIAGFEERFPILAERRDLPAGQLSGGEQQVLAIVRALVARPRLLLLDEPSLGLAPRLVEAVFAMVAEIHAAGVTVLLVEQNAYRALALADRGYVVETGRITMSGRGQELLDHPEVRRAYLGG